MTKQINTAMKASRCYATELAIGDVSRQFSSVYWTPDNPAFGYLREHFLSTTADDGDGGLCTTAMIRALCLDIGGIMRDLWGCEFDAEAVGVGAVIATPNSLMEDHRDLFRNGSLLELASMLEAVMGDKGPHWTIGCEELAVRLDAPVFPKVLDKVVFVVEETSEPYAPEHLDQLHEWLICSWANEANFVFIPGTAIGLGGDKVDYGTDWEAMGAHVYEYWSPTMDEHCLGIVGNLPAMMPAAQKRRFARLSEDMQSVFFQGPGIW